MFADKPIKVCRTCLNELSESECFYLDSVESEACSIRSKLMQIVPEMNLDLTSDAVICLDCSYSIKYSYKFKKKCQTTEKYIQTYVQKVGFSAGSVDLHKLLKNRQCATIDDDVIQIDDECLDLTTEPQHNSVDIDEGHIPHLEIVDMDCVLINSDPDSFLINDIKNSENTTQTNKLENARNNKDSYKCNECVLTFNSKSDLDTHLGSHRVKEKPYHKCTRCSYRSMYKSNLTSHIKRRHNSVSPSQSPTKNNPKANLYECHVCGFTTNNKIGLISHTRDHTGKKPYECHQCDFKAANKQELTTHSKTHAKNKLKCALCNFSTTHKFLLSIHVKSHTGKKPYKCDICEHRTAHRFTLKLHMITCHSKLEHRNYECNLCTFSCVLKSAFVHHMNEHARTTLCSCASCNYCMYFKQPLLRYMQSCNEDPAFKCDMCPYTASSLYALTVHARTHTGNKPFKCTQCSYSAFQKSRLINHMKVHYQSL